MKDLVSGLSRAWEDRKLPIKPKGADAIVHSTGGLIIRDWKVHSYNDNSAYRSFMINCTELYRIIDQPDEYLRLSLSAMPDINDEKNMVGYRTFEDGDIDYIELNSDELKEFFPQIEPWLSISGSRVSRKIGC